MGAALRDRQDMHAQRQVELAQKQAALAQQQQMKEKLAALAANPTTEGIAALSIEFPQFSEHFKRSFDMMDATKKQAKVERAGQAYAALHSDKPEIAEKLLRDQAIAYRNGGDEAGAKSNEHLAELIKTDPKTAKMIAGTYLSAVLGPGKFAETFKTLGTEARANELQSSAVAKGAAEADEKRVEATTKALGAIGQKAGALALAKNVKPEQVQAMFKSLAASGAIPKEELSSYLDSIPQDPKAIPGYLNTYKLAGMKPDDQMKYTTPDANTVANNITSRANTKDNNRTQLQVQDKINARMEAKGDAEPTLPPEALSMMAQQYLAGDKSVMQNLGRGAQGAANIVALRAAITKEASAKGMTGPQIAAQMADYAGLTAGMRTSANISARVENAISEAKELAPLAIEASKEVARSGLLPFGKAQIMFNTQTNDPALKKFVTANNGLVSAYAGAMARGQKPTVSDYDHAREILTAAQSHDAYVATVNQMYAEMKAASRAPQNVREHLRNEIGGGHASPAPVIPAGWSVKEH